MTHNNTVKKLCAVMVTSVIMYQVYVEMVVHVSTMMGLILVCVLSPGPDHSVISVGIHGYLTFYCFIEGVK
jgi:hypothetical protein